MASVTSSFRHLPCQGQWFRAPRRPIALPRPRPRIHAQARYESSQSSSAAETESSAESSTESSAESSAESPAEALEATLKIPFQNITHARCIPTTPSYFSREPQFNDLHVRVTDLLGRYRNLPVVKPSEAPAVPWAKLDAMRQHFDEPIKAARFAMVMRVVKRLSLIVPELVPEEVKSALQPFKREINPLLNQARPLHLDRFGRAVGAGRRKASTARAFVVEGTGEILINGKQLDQVFGRVFDRESAVWALTSTARMDKYNVWALVEGGGTTGQSQALALAIGKALLAHEPGLKPALRKAGCITRDPRSVERKKHGRVKARKRPTWVKR